MIETRIPLAVAEAEFVKKYGLSSAEFRVRWRGNGIPDTTENNLISCEATSLEPDPITAEEFTAGVGSAPVHDDLERVNCGSAGLIGHYGCGWCENHKKPRFMCGCFWVYAGAGGVPDERKASP